MYSILEKVGTWPLGHCLDDALGYPVLVIGSNSAKGVGMLKAVAVILQDSTCKYLIIRAINTDKDADRQRFGL